MNSNKIYEVGFMLGLNPEDIQKILSDNSIQDSFGNKKMPFSLEIEYGTGFLYGTLNLKNSQ